MTQKIYNAKLVGTANTETRTYIGRPSVWGNPFEIGLDGKRPVVIRKFREWIVDQPDLMARLPELKGKNLICWCAPEACHGEVLLKLLEKIQ